MHRASKVMADGLVDHATPQAGARAAHADKSGHASAVGDDRAVVIEQAGLEIDGLIGRLDLRRVQRAVAGWTTVGLADLDDAFVAQVAETAKEGIAKGWGMMVLQRRRGHPELAVTCWEGVGCQIQPFSASESGVPSPMMMWSRTRTSTRARASVRRPVSSRSAELGSGQPEGWL